MIESSPVAALRVFGRRRSRGLLLTFLVGLGFLLGFGATAYAHSEVIATTPAADETLAATPASVELFLDETPVAMGTQIVVTGPSGPVHTGAPEIDETTVTQALQPGSPAGRYTVDWRITSGDGHPINGSFTFTSTEAGGGASTASPAPLAAPTATEVPAAGAPTALPDPVSAAEETGVPGYGVVIGVVLVIALIVMLLSLLRRRRRRTL